MRNTQSGPLLIGVGLVILFGASYSLSAPVVTPLAIIALGGTDAVTSRFRGSPAAVPILVLHAMVYAVLYALFIGARLQVPADAQPIGLRGLVTLDLFVSAFPMSIALKRISSCLWQSALSRH